MRLCLYVILMASVLADLRCYRIPNHLIASGLCLGIFSMGCSEMALAFLSDIAKVLLFVILIYPLFWIRALGAGDIKLLMVVALFLGIGRAATVLIISVFAGSIAGLMKLIYCQAVKPERKDTGICRPGFRVLLTYIRQGHIRPLLDQIGKTHIHFSIYIFIGVILSEYMEGVEVFQWASADYWQFVMKMKRLWEDLQIF